MATLFLLFGFEPHSQSTGPWCLLISAVGRVEWLWHLAGRGEGAVMNGDSNDLTSKTFRGNRRLMPAAFPFQLSSTIAVNLSALLEAHSLPFACPSHHRLSLPTRPFSRRKNFSFYYTGSRVDRDRDFKNVKPIFGNYTTNIQLVTSNSIPLHKTEIKDVIWKSPSLSPARRFSRRLREIINNSHYRIVFRLGTKCWEQLWDAMFRKGRRRIKARRKKLPSVFKCSPDRSTISHDLASASADAFRYENRLFNGCTKKSG